MKPQSPIQSLANMPVNMLLLAAAMPGRVVAGRPQ